MRGEGVRRAAPQINRSATQSSRLPPSEARRWAGPLPLGSEPVYGRTSREAASELTLARRADLVRDPLADRLAADLSELPQRNHLWDVAERVWLPHVVAVLLAGGPGSGKSSVSHSLRDRGLSSVDLDFGYARWEDVDGRVVGLPEAPTRQWLDHHFWRWDEHLDIALRSASAPTLFAGTAADMLDHLDRFDLVLVLTLDDHTQRSRLAASSRDNDFGRVGSTAAWSLDYRVQVENDLFARGCRTIDARPPLYTVVRTVLQICRAAGCALDDQPRWPPSSAFPDPSKSP